MVQVNFNTEMNEFLEEASAFFAASRRRSAKNERMKFIALKTQNGKLRIKLLSIAERLMLHDRDFIIIWKVEINPGRTDLWRLL